MGGGARHRVVRSSPGTTLSDAPPGSSLNPILLDSYGGCTTQARMIESSVIGDSFSDQCGGGAGLPESSNPLMTVGSPGSHPQRLRCGWKGFGMIITKDTCHLYHSESISEPEESTQILFLKRCPYCSNCLVSSKSFEKSLTRTVLKTKCAFHVNHNITSGHSRLTWRQGTTTKYKGRPFVVPIL